MRNVDKSLKAGDANYTQRVEMMIAAAQDMPPSSNVAVAVIDEPSFVGKSTKITNWFAQRDLDVRLTFVLGTDTITRFFEQRYYPSNDSMMASIQHFFMPKDRGGEDSRIICARRHSDASTDDIEAFLDGADVREYVRTGKIHLLDISPEEAMMSSTAVRNGVSASGLESISWGRTCTPSVGLYIQDHKLYIT